jgi:hypothetical protein
MYHVFLTKSTPLKQRKQHIHFCKMNNKTIKTKINGALLIKAESECLIL